jgi:hypothetical protein
MDLVIAIDDGVMSIDNQPLAIDTSAFPANVSLVAYDCKSGSGSIEYNDRLRLLVPLTDVTPYAAYVNNWMTAAALVSGMPLTLAQARTVKIGLVDGIFNSKRQLPIFAIGNNWDATDESLIGMQAAITAWDVANAITIGNSVVADSVNNMGIYVSTTTSTVTNTITTTNSTIIATMSCGWSQLGGAPYSILSITPVLNVSAVPSSSQSVSNSGSNSSSSASHDRVNFGVTKGPDIAWPPLDSPTTIGVSMADMRSLISSIQSRRSQLQSTRLTKITAINALSTIPAAIAYDATAGWPF